MMGGGSVLLEIVIFAAVAAFFIYRLRSVLGRRHGEERERPNPFVQRQGEGVPATEPDNVIPLPDRRPLEPVNFPDDGPISVADGVRQIQSADANFSEKGFLAGARAAFEMIVGAFAAGDTPTLRPLLADDIYDQFAAAIRQRQQAGEVLESRIHKIESIDLTAARLDGRTAICTVSITSYQTHVTRDSAGTIVEGNPATQEEVVDIWTFQRNTRAGTPNWLLVETRTPN
jgi:predicted lipid-binding transport protein (Tim44 family)